jgi:CheY-like chemotaxis protein
MDEKKILIVDDDAPIRCLLEEIFRLQNYTVKTAESAEDALDILKKESVMVMFLDLQLPGMSGIDLCRTIRKDDQIAVIHALTGYSNLFGLLECRLAGFDDILMKPAVLKTLIEAAEQAFNKIERWKVFEYGLV